MTKAFIRAAGVAAAAAAVLSVAGDGHAQQIDVNPPMPNVLILLDNSGSMERMIDGTLPEATPTNVCNCDPASFKCDNTRNPVPNRWGTVQQALTGQLANGYNCVAMPRTPGGEFSQEYKIGTTSPYDTSYYLPFHRMVALDTAPPATATTPVPCVITPAMLPGAPLHSGVGPSGNGDPTRSADSYATGDILPLPLGQPTSPTQCNFTQLANGAIDSMSPLVRFGLMTFDQDPLANTGVTGNGATPPVFTVAANPFIGMWSYYPGWSTAQACTLLGNPVGCTSPPTIMAVGARNSAAPLWEGRMVPFTSTADSTTTNNAVQDVIRSSRPYGATPLAGMLTGAEYYLWNDPTGPQATDVDVKGDCRPEFIIILTDGAPNQDMRPSCAPSSTSGDAGTSGGSAGICPFALPKDIVATLYNNGLPLGTNQTVKTYVIGFAVSKFTDGSSTIQCSSLVSNGQLASVCSANPVSELYAPCCTLQNIAINGGSKHAYFADSPGDLQSALGAILGDIASQSTTRTTPAYSPVVGNASDPTSPVQEIFYASFTPASGEPWFGDIQRVVTTCQATSATSSSSSAASSSTSSSSSSSSANTANGSDFAVDLNANGSTRTFIAFEPATGGTAAGSIRPYIAPSVTDGVGSSLATMFTGSAAAVIPNITPDVIGYPTTGAGYAYTPNNAVGTANLTPAQTRDMVLDFEFGQPASAFTGPSNFTFQPRAPSVFGDIYHASPIVVGPPGSLIEDPSYQAFRTLCATGNCGTVPSTSCTASTSTSSGTASQQRPTVVYAATNDGLLHAFWADVPCNLANPELWAMLLPAAMPNLSSTYPANHYFLLDGSPIVKDVVWDRNSSNLTQTTQGLWHTTLVAGFGSKQRGYYAVDVTNTTPTSVASPPIGPDLRWQLTTIPGSFQIFGKYSAKPAITTLSMDPDGNGVREIGVAILPGGWDGPPASPTACVRATNQASTEPSGYAKRPSVRCWGATANTNTGVNGRALTIVRLDTGEVLRVFAQLADFPKTGTTIDLKRVVDSPLDSPLTGTPMVYPTDVGAVATKVFISDADGTIWRFDLSNTDPTKWGPPSVFLDLYNQYVDPNTSTSWSLGQPLQVDPVLSLDPAAHLVLNMATGTTDTFDANGQYFVYSVTEQPNTSGSVNAQVNWILGSTSKPSSLRAGERVAGPMAVFNGKLYFATYYAGDPSLASCTSGDARIWGMDFVVPYGGAASCTNDPDPCRLNGGVFSPDVDPTLALGYIDVGTSFPGRVVPGVAVQATPACGAFTSTVDPYTGGTHQQLGQLQSQPSFQLVGMVGGVSTGGIPATKSVAITTPMAPTMIDSWASVLE
jgi:type IV pilus assembly protein PilY1